MTAEQNVIELIINNESDLYCPYNKNHELNDDVTDYIIKESQKKRIRGNVVIRIISSSSVDESRVRSSFIEWVIWTDTFVKQEVKSNLLKEILMIIIGVFFISLSIIFQSDFNTTINTVLSVLGALAIWEAVSIWIMQKNTMKRHARTINKWKKGIKIEFQYSE